MQQKWIISVLTRCVCETQMPLIMAKSKDGKGHKDKYIDTCTKILLREMLMYNMKAIALTVQKLLARLKFSKKWVILQGKGHRLKNNGIHGKVL